MNKRTTGKALGQGIGALISAEHINEALKINDNDQVIAIQLANLRPNPYQPRKYFNADSIQELAASIKEHGVIQPIIVREVIKGYEIIAGERRFRASQLCNLETIPSVVRKFSDQQVMEIALVENVQREDLNAMEVAVAYQSIIDQFELTQEELSLKVGKSRSHITNFLRLLQLPETIKQYVSRGTLTMGHARALAGIKDNKVKSKLAEITINEQWSVRQLEEAIKKLEVQSHSNKELSKKSKKKDPYMDQIEERLRGLYQTTVKIQNQKNRGKIELLYYSKDDLERLLDLLQGIKG